MSKLFTAVLMAASFALPAAAQNQLDFLSDLTQFHDLRQMLPDYLQQRAERRLAERRRRVANLETQSAVDQRRAYIRKTMLEGLGGLPERTPLNARTVGVVERDRYKVEKVIFESQPGFYVTANVYLPKSGSPPYPAVLYPLGHEQGGKSHDAWQRMLGSLATKGYVALAWDPPGQGERAQMYDRDFKQRKLVRSTTEHTMLGIQCLVTGDSLARYTIWDGIRALDYLLSRPEVDKGRVACTGNSGGGTHTAYLSALDDRIGVAAPSCYLTSWSKLLDTIGPQDAEQLIMPWIGAGLDHGDFVIAFAPKPYLILSAIRDFFSIAGARATYAEAQALYQRLGAAEKIAMSEVDRGHGYHQPNRLAAYRWLARWLKGEEDNEPEPNIDIAAFHELACTETGQVATSLGGETVFTLNNKRAERLDPELPKIEGASDLPSYRREIRDRVRKLAVIDYQAADVETTPYGAIQRSGYRVEKLTYESEPGILIPALAFVPDGGPERKPAILYVDGNGKSAEGREGGDIEWLVKTGHVVLAPDLRGLGETRQLTEDSGSDWPRYFGDYNSAMTSFLLDETLVGMRTVDVLRGLDLLTARDDVDSDRISGIGKRAGALPLLYAAVLDERIQRVAFEEILVSYRSVVEHRIHRQVLENIIPGVLKQFDLQDLIAGLAPRDVLVVNPVDPLGNPLWPDPARDAYARPMETYRTAGAADSIRIVRREPEQSVADIYTAWR